MIFRETPLAGAYVLDIEPRADARGFFARTVDRDEFARYGLDANFVQQSVSWNPHLGTLRGLHYQAAPHEEDKLVRVTRGAIFDVIVDLRTKSTTHGHWYGVELTALNHRQLYIPKGFAHGFQTLQSDTEVFYEMTVPFHPDAPRGVRWDDPDLGIVWPYSIGAGDTRMSYSDLQHPLLKELAS
ncbi:MAG: dTDP-4-dehydrorhamnose 3,5-epimerase [Candidatus Devosia phytovorans]|uniref:dTDP-4-dehydrorhamnose 3,5-epimerase n=1 Tax=Candidatus Devosia phytovorans TaxID=3121372 RepID=A0AAJ5VUM9_9HYPH|nr:dTDP-4-dehydrorhamnose 3,5-epimerase [Devosia sp.]WEK03783.1 MAG: dTDP-4-dehydrorhamnose 3,5-epimerase [Devosia sp.]